MYSREHLATSLLAGGALVPVVDTPLGPAGTVAFAALLGTLVDLDHFVVARLRTGSWAAVRRALDRPGILVVDQAAIFEPGTVGRWTRIASHLAITAVLVLVFLATVASLAVVTAVVLGLHIVADVLWDAWRPREGAGPDWSPATGHDAERQAGQDGSAAVGPDRSGHAGTDEGQPAER